MSPFPDQRRPPPCRRRGASRGLRGLLACAAAALLVAPAARAASAGRAIERLRIAATPAPVSLPLYVAQQRGFFVDEDLDVVIEDCVGGVRCLHMLLDGKADVATMSEMPVVLHSFAHANVAVIATMVSASDDMKLIARKGSGIVAGEQLDGRNVGVITGSAAQYLLETYLLTVGVDPRHVTMVPVQPEDTVAALRSGRIDAVALWEPFGYEALHGTRANAVGVRLPSSGYIENYNLVAGLGTLGTRDAVLLRLLRAVDRAEQFILAHPADAQAILRDRLQLDQRVVDWVWGGLGFRLSLDQALLSTMESESRWALREGHVPAGARTNVLALTYPGPLRSLRPSAVGTGN
jgi:ABC-type nitrate/sulfonate/bicarbonate transport system substrate-binding protein